jgi:hypothetical protein
MLLALLLLSMVYLIVISSAHRRVSSIFHNTNFRHNINRTMKLVHVRGGMAMSTSTDELHTETSNSIDNLRKLRGYFDVESIDAFIVPSDDPHMSGEGKTSEHMLNIGIEKI